MNSGVVAKGLRTGEIALSVLGVSLLCWALAAVVNTRVYQARQGRAFSRLEGRPAAERQGVSSPPALAARGPSAPVSP